jgi:hypothetical protein
LRFSAHRLASLIVLIAVTLAVAIPAFAADGDGGLASAYPSVDRTSTNYSSVVQRVIDSLDSQTPGSAITNAVAGPYSEVSAWFAAGLLRERDGMLQVYVPIDGDIDDPLRDALAGLGAVIEVESGEEGIVQASVPYSALSAVGALAGVASVTEPTYGVVNAGGNLTEGDTLLNYDDLRSLQGVDGTGVTVGVISDGIAGLQTAVASGDLPATSETRSGATLTATSGGVIATSFRADDDLEGGLGSGPGAEGTAILEIVHDIAPGAQLRFANFNTSLEFHAAVNFLASVSDVVIDDIGFFGPQTDGSSAVSTNTSSALNNNANSIRSYVTSAGNQAQQHYEGLFASGASGLSLTGLPGALHSFTASSGTTDALGLGTQTYNSVRMTTGQILVVWLVWEDIEGAPVADYDLFLQDPAVGIVGGSAIINALSGTPREAAAIQYNGPGTVDLRIIVQNFNNDSPAKDFELVVFGVTP